MVKSLRDVVLRLFLFEPQILRESFTTARSYKTQLSVIPETWQWKIPDLYIISPLKASFFSALSQSAMLDFFLIEDWKFISLTFCTKFCQII